MRIEIMTADHVSQVAELEKRSFQDPWSENSIASELNNPLSLWLVALEGDLVIGYVGSQTVLDETDMMNIAVHPDYRRQGIAEALVQELVSYLRKRGSRCQRKLYAVMLLTEYTWLSTTSMQASTV